MSHTIRDKKALLTRVRRIAGQAAALEKALEQESEHLGATDCTPQQRQQDLEVVLTALRSYLK